MTQDALATSLATLAFGGVVIGRTADLKQALEQGLDPNVLLSEEGGGLLAWAVTLGHVDQIRLLLEHGAEVQRPHERYMDNLVTVACTTAKLSLPDKIAVFDLLWAAGGRWLGDGSALVSDVLSQSKSDQWPLAERLLAAGASPLGDGLGLPPLFAGINRNRDDHTGWLDRLVAAGATLAVRNEDGLTLFQEAVEHGALKTAQWAVDKGEDPGQSWGHLNPTDRVGAVKTAQEWAEYAQWPLMVQWLQAAVAHKSLAGCMSGAPAPSASIRKRL